ncbi:CsgE family curli-type amyloid fiber assembly protein [Spirosoma fluviale]|uniref:Curli production assembly/transport component CsgE n=1 Tax=Spirosoma fluviale TaxID=1597977 RepID=A0A286G130_9BACT|nr:CsgE family curli-type amyloid fiber assembly protein [Spirosoma fluviale]SOD88869.1 Curli assembly protein CsgE [Spirosoma fluviale]
MRYWLNPTHYLFTVVLMLLCGCLAFAQDPASEEDAESLAVEERLSEQGPQTLILDNSRTKIGREFYDSFFRAFVLPAPTMPADSSQLSKKPQDLETDSWVITIEELPSTSATSNIISVSINDELIWQQFVQARIDLIEEYALNAVETLRQYIISYEQTQQQLQTEDQKGTGIH